MPIYEYKCSKCGHQLECLQKFSDEPLTQCPKCGKDTLKRCISLPSFQLKGTGWYETDFKNKKKPEIKKEEKSKEKTTETQTSKSKETKKEEKS